MNDLGYGRNGFCSNLGVWGGGGGGGGLVARQEGYESLLHIFVFTYLSLRILRSKFEFLSVAPTKYLQK